MPMTIEEEVRLLSTVDILEPLSEEELEELARRSPDRHLEPGEIFYTPNDNTERLFILKQGRVRVYKTTEGRELTLSIVDSGTVFGEMSLTAQRLQGAYAEAMERPCASTGQNRPPRATARNRSWRSTSQSPRKATTRSYTRVSRCSTSLAR